MRLGLDFSRFGSCFSARKDIPCGVENRMLDKILFRRIRFSLFLQPVTLTYEPCHVISNNVAPLHV